MSFMFVPRTSMSNKTFKNLFRYELKLQLQRTSLTQLSSILAQLSIMYNMHF